MIALPDYLITASVKRTYIGAIFPNSVKIDSLDLQCFHRASKYNEVWRRESYITLFSSSSHSKGFPASFTEWEKCRAHDRPVQTSLEIGAPSSTTSFIPYNYSTESGAARLFM